MNDWILQISSGVGPVEVRRFVAQLALLLAAELRKQGMRIEATIRYGKPKWPRTVQLHFSGEVDKLSALEGTYVLVTRNPARKRHARKRWFAGVQLFSREAMRGAFLFDESQVTFSTARSGGPGGQHVNRTESAVRAVHQPSQISVRVSSERSQHQNRRSALRLLQHALGEQARQRRMNATREHRDHHYQLVRGNAVRAFRHDRRGRLVMNTNH